MGRLTTHVLDTAQGCPARGVRVTLFALRDGGRHFVTAIETNAQGRCDAPLCEGEAFSAGVYELCFAIGDYYSKSGFALPQPPFLDEAVVRFGVSSPSESYHVPLTASPYGYATYRGS